MQPLTDPCMPSIDIDMVSPGFIDRRLSYSRRESDEAAYSLASAGQARALSAAEVVHVKKLELPVCPCVAQPD